MRFNPQQVDKVHGNYFIYDLFGPNTNIHHKNFNALFDFQNHLIKPLPKINPPNWRFLPLLMPIQYIFIPIWILGVAFSIYETTMRFKFHHAEKKGWRTKQKVTDYRHMLFFRKDTHIKYLCTMILRQLFC